MQLAVELGNEGVQRAVYGRGKGRAGGSGEGAAGRGAADVDVALRVDGKGNAGVAGGSLLRLGEHG